MGSVAGERDPKIEPGKRTRKPTQKQGNATVINIFEYVFSSTSPSRGNDGWSFIASFQVITVVYETGFQVGR